MDELERRIRNDVRWQSGKTWGKPRRGHPEGSVELHIEEIFANIARLPLSEAEIAQLRIIALLHDSYKKEVNQNKLKRGNNSHAYIASLAAREFNCSDTIIKIIAHHDDAYFCYRQHCKGVMESERGLVSLIELLGDDLSLYLDFYWCDNRTGDKEPQSFDWTLKTIDEYTRNLRLKLLWRRLGQSLLISDEKIEKTWDEVEGNYSQLERTYHNMSHVTNVVDKVWFAPQSSKALVMAAFLHDVIYDPRRQDNEEQSAIFARNYLNPNPGDKKVASLILATKTHVGKNHEERMLLDADLGILGADATTYDTYSRQIREEYSFVSEADYRGGRIKVLESFLNRQIFYFDKALENMAKSNIAREIANLRS